MNKSFDSKSFQSDYLTQWLLKSFSDFIEFSTKYYDLHL